MIADPVNSRFQNVLGSGVSSVDVTADMVAFGPGSKTTRNLNVPLGLASYLASGKFSFEHSETKGSRRRSVLRLDLQGLANIDNLAISAISTSAYLVLDRPVNLLGGQQDKGVIDANLSILINSLVTSKASAGDAVWSALLQDWYRGEP